MRTRTLARLVASLAFASLGTPALLAQHDRNAEGATATAPTASDIPDRGAASPKELLESMATLLAKPGPPQDWLSFEPPANRDLAKAELQLNVQLGTKTKEAADLVETKIGKTESTLVRSGQGGITPGCELELRNAITAMSKDGKIDWDKVKITEAPDKARAATADGNSKILLIKVADKWYLGEGEGPGKDTLAQDVDSSKKMSAKLLKVMDQLETKVNSGDINKKNFYTEYPNLINAAFSDFP